MTNEVQKIAYTPVTDVSSETLKKLRQDDTTATSPIFNGNTSSADDVQLTKKLNLKKEDRAKVIQLLEEQVKNTQEQLSNIKAHQGWIGKCWDGLKNLTHIGAGSDKSQNAVNELKAKIEILKSNPEKLEEVFKEITGGNLTSENLNKLLNGELSLKGQERVVKYEQGQGMAKGLVSTIATIGAVTGLMAAGIVATPFSGGASLGASLLACGAILGTGAAVSVAVNSSDALTSEAKDYSLKQAAKDATSGAVDGALTVATAGIGNAVVKGTQVAAKTTRFGSVLLKPTVQHTITGVATGAAFGGGGAATDYALNSEEFKIGELLKVTGKGTVSGATFGGVAGAMGSKMATVNLKVANSTTKINNKFLSKTINGTTKAGTTALTGFVGGGASSELEYLTSADNVTADGALDAFVTGGQGGSAMMLGFEAVNKGVMKLPKKTQPLKPNERQVFEVERDDYIENPEWLEPTTKIESKKLRSRQLLEKLVTSESESHLGIKGGKAAQNKIIESVSADLFEFLMQRKGKHVSVEELQAFYKQVFPQINLEISGEVSQMGTFSGGGVAVASYKPILSETNNRTIGNRISLSSKSRIDRIKDFMHIKRDNGFYVDPIFIDCIIHENVHLMQNYFSPFSSKFHKSLERATAGTVKSNIDGLKRNFSFAYKGEVYHEAPLFYSQKRFGKKLDRALTPSFYNRKITLRSKMAMLERAIRGAEGEQQAYTFGDYYKLLAENPRRGQHKFFQKRYQKRVAKDIESYYKFDSKIEEMRRLYAETYDEYQILSGKPKRKPQAPAVNRRKVLKELKNMKDSDGDLLFTKKEYAYFKKLSKEKLVRAYMLAKIKSYPEAKCQWANFKEICEFINLPEENFAQAKFGIDLIGKDNFHKLTAGESIKVGNYTKEQFDDFKFVVKQMTKSGSIDGSIALSYVELPKDKQAEFQTLISRKRPDGKYQLLKWESLNITEMPKAEKEKVLWALDNTSLDAYKCMEFAKFGEFEFKRAKQKHKLESIKPSELTVEQALDIAEFPTELKKYFEEIRDDIKHTAESNGCWSEDFVKKQHQYIIDDIKKIIDLPEEKFELLDTVLQTQLSNCDKVHLISDIYEINVNEFKWALSQKTFDGKDRFTFDESLSFARLDAERKPKCKWALSQKTVDGKDRCTLSESFTFAYLSPDNIQKCKCALVQRTPDGKDRFSMHESIELSRRLNENEFELARQKYFNVPEIDAETICYMSKDNTMPNTFAGRKQAYSNFFQIYNRYRNNTKIKSLLNLDTIKRNLEATITSATSPIMVPSEAKTKFFKQSITLNNTETLKTIQGMDKIISQYGKEGFPLQYKRQSFVQDLAKLLKDLPENQRKEILNKIEIEFTQDNTGYDGLVVLDKLDVKTPVEKQVKELCEKFLLHNSVQTGDVNVDKVLNALIQGLPEFVNIIGKKHHGTHQYTIDAHTIKVLQSALSNPKFENLSNLDKMCLQLTIMLHDLAKREGVVDKGHEFLSAMYAQDILKKFNLPVSVKDRIVEMIKNHNWWERLNTNAISERDVAVMFRKPEDLIIAEIFAKADLKGVSDGFYNTNIGNFDTRMIKCQKAQKELHEGGNMLFTTRVVNSDKIPRQTLNGHEYKVIDFTQIPENADLFDYGLSVHKKSDFRVLNHCGNFKIVMELSNPVNEGFLCTTLISPTKKVTFSSAPSLMLEADNANIINSFYENQGSGERRAFSDFVNFMLGTQPVHRYHQRDIFLNTLKKYNLTQEQYGRLYKQIQDKRFLSQIKDVVIDGISVKKEDIIEAYKNIEDWIMKNTDERHNEVNIYNPKVKGIIEKVNSLSEVSEDTLTFAREHDLPIFILGK